ncbi:hypothetical protein HDV00_007471 [Rhizophlyctis rosea]|nr:hypothetical protein HDV00_007471 [Rhizophlyctis rosea]
MFAYNPYYGSAVPMYRQTQPHPHTCRHPSSLFVSPYQLQTDYEEELYRRRQAEHMLRIQALREQEEREKQAMIQAEMERRARAALVQRQKEEYLRRVQLERERVEQQRRVQEQRRVQQLRQQQQQQQQQPQPVYRWLVDGSGAPVLWFEQQPRQYEDGEEEQDVENEEWMRQEEEEEEEEQPLQRSAPTPATIPIRTTTPPQQTIRPATASRPASPQQQPQQAQPTTTPIRIPIRSPTPTQSEITHLRHNIAARRIQRLYRTHLKQTRLTLSKLAILNEVAAGLDTLITTQREAALSTTLKFNKSGTIALGVKENMPLLGYEEQLVKLMIRVDAVESGGVESVRERRKEVVRRIQGELDGVDRRKRGMPAVEGKEGEGEGSEMEVDVEGVRELFEGVDGKGTVEGGDVDVVQEHQQPEPEASEDQQAVEDQQLESEVAMEVDVAPNMEAQHSEDEGWDMLDGSSSETSIHSPTLDSADTLVVPDFHDGPIDPAPDEVDVQGEESNANSETPNSLTQSQNPSFTSQSPAANDTESASPVVVSGGLGSGSPALRADVVDSSVEVVA